MSSLVRALLDWRQAMNDELRDRYRGALVGSAVGDALGATVEFMDTVEIIARYGRHTEIIGGGWLRLEAGEVTDDTQMALCIAESIVDLGRFDPEDVAVRFVAWYRSNPPDIGNTTRASLKRLSEGARWTEAGLHTHEQMRPGDASNGSIMRCAPIALLFRTDPAGNARASADSSRITHANPLAIDCCVALNAAIAGALDEPSGDLLDIAVSAATDQDVIHALEQAPNLSAGDIDAGGYVLSTMQCAFWSVANAASFEDALLLAVNFGQDADTSGAVTGALAGARWGYHAIPPRWRKALLDTDRFILNADELLKLSVA